jgi:hypothetical protein
MDDDDWMKADDDAPATAGDAAAAPAEGELPAVSDEGGVETAADFKANKYQLYKHWVR